MIKNDNENEKIERFIKFITELRNHREARIARKEVAAWSATVLYFTVLMTLSKFFPQKSE